MRPHQPMSVAGRVERRVSALLELGGMESEEEAAGFRKAIVAKLLQIYLEEGKTKVGSDALLVMAEFLKIFVTEAAARAARQAKSEDSDVVHIEQVEKILPQLLLDF